MLLKQNDNPLNFKIMKTKLTNMFRGKERNKEKIFKVKQRYIKKIYMY